MTREDAETMFDLMELYREEHPDATDDECFEAIIWGRRKIPTGQYSGNTNEQTPHLHI